MTAPTAKPTKATPRKAVNSRTPIAEEAPPTVSAVQVMAYEKPTKNTVRFQAVSAPGATPTLVTLYLPNTTAAALGEPTRIKVTIEPLED